MKKESKHLIMIIAMAIIGSIVGFILGKIQIQQLQDPDFIQQLMSHNMMIHEPMGVINSMLLGTCVFSGVTTGLILYNHLTRKFTAAVRVMVGILAFPFYSIAGIIGVIPFLIYQVVLLIKKSRRSICDSKDV